MFDNSKLNNMDQIFGGDQTGRAGDTVYGSTYDVRAATQSKDGYTPDVNQTTAQNDNPGRN